MRHPFRKPCAVALAALFAVAACGPDDGLAPVPAHIAPPVLAAMASGIEQGRYGRIKAVLVESGGENLYGGYFGGFSPGDRIDVRSVGKSLTALALGKALEQGALPGLDLSAWDYLVGNASVAHDGPVKRAIAVADLVSMSSALACNDWVRSSPGNEERMYDRDDWTGFVLNLPLDPDYARRPDGQGRFSYCTAGVFLLGRIVEQATGVRFDAYVQREVFDPLGISDVKWRFSPRGEVQSGGQIEMRPQDLARIGRMVMNGGEYGGKQVIDTDWLRAMLTPRNGVTPEMDYAYLWWTRNFVSAEKGTIGGAFMQGNGGNMVLLLPAYDAVVVIAATNYNRDNAFENSLALVEDFIIPALDEEEDA